MKKSIGVSRVRSDRNENAARMDGHILGKSRLLAKGPFTHAAAKNRFISVKRIESARVHAWLASFFLIPAFFRGQRRFAKKGFTLIP